MDAAESDRPRLRYPRAARLIKRRDFERVRKQGSSLRDGTLRIGYLVRPQAEAGPARLGLAVGRRLGKAPHRNRIKRVLREAFRLAPGRFPANVDLVVIPLDRKAAASFDDARRSFDQLARRMAKRLAEPAPKPKQNG